MEKFEYSQESQDWRPFQTVDVLVWPGLNFFVEAKLHLLLPGCWPSHIRCHE